MKSKVHPRYLRGVVGGPGVAAVKVCYKDGKNMSLKTFRQNMVYMDPTRPSANKPASPASKQDTVASGSSPAPAALPRLRFPHGPTGTTETDDEKKSFLSNSALAKVAIDYAVKPVQITDSKTLVARAERWVQEGDSMEAAELYSQAADLEGNKTLRASYYAKSGENYIVSIGFERMAAKAFEKAAVADPEGLSVTDYTMKAAEAWLQTAEPRRLTWGQDDSTHMKARAYANAASNFAGANCYSGAATAYEKAAGTIVPETVELALEAAAYYMNASACYCKITLPGKTGGMLKEEFKKFADMLNEAAYLYTQAAGLEQDSKVKVAHYLKAAHNYLLLGEGEKASVAFDFVSTYADESSLKLRYSLISKKLYRHGFMNAKYQFAMRANHLDKGEGRHAAAAEIYLLAADLETDAESKADILRHAADNYMRAGDRKSASIAYGAASKTAEAEYASPQITPGYVSMTKEERDARAKRLKDTVFECDGLAAGAGLGIDPDSE